MVRDRSRVKTYAVSPYSVALARSTASSSVVNVVIGATGPKISWRVDVGVDRHVGQDRRAEEVAGPVRRAAAGHDPGAGPDRLVDQRGDARDRLVVDQRTDVDTVVLAATEPEGAHPLAELLGELLGHRLLDEEPVRGRAGLAHVAHLGDHRAVDGRVDVGVGEHEERGVAAELHADPLQLVG